MELLQIIIVAIFAYLIGSIPTSIWVGRYFRDIDIRKYGSGNAGATNMIRVLGWKIGLPVLVFDIFKGWMAVKLALWVQIPDASWMSNYNILLGVLAVIGHIYPVFAGFKGGKGVATITGAVLSLSPLPFLGAFIIFFIVFSIFKIVSISSVTAGFSFPFFQFWLGETNALSYQIFSIVIAILLFITHLKNMNRLLKGEEKKMEFKKKISTIT